MKIGYFRVQVARDCGEVEPKTPYSSRFMQLCKLSAFTLTEVVITMLVIAVIVGVSIKLTKAKLDNITSYTYYSAYSTLNSVTKEMLKDYDANNPDYIAYNSSLVSKIKFYFASQLGICPAFAMIPPCNGGCPTGWKCEGNQCIEPQTPGGEQVPDKKLKDCLILGLTFDSILGECVPVEDVGTNSNFTEPSCPAGKELDLLTDSCVCIAVPPEVIPCGKEWSDTQCGLVDKTSFPPVCSAGQWFNNDDLVCDCVPSPQAIPRSGANYCKLFANYANTSVAQAFRECNGTRIGANETDFSDKTPDIILRNGIRLYNVSQNPEPIGILSGNSKGRTYTGANGNPVDIDEWGYTLYIDIDGSRGGNGRLWEDVYPFYVTLSGAVIPAYDTQNPSLSGGDSRQHLQISVHDEFIENNSKRKTQWVTKSSSFKHSACAMGYVNAATTYCTSPPAVAANPQCAVQGHDCRLKTVMPVKFFGR